MTPEDALKLARKVADEREAPMVAPQAPVDSNAEPSDSDATYEALLEPPQFLHDREIQDAIRVLTLIASGRNPFSEEPFEKLRPEHRDSVLEALCVIVVTLAQRRLAPLPVSDSKAPSIGTSDPSNKRPLQQYLDRLEREAILEAIEEAKHNRTAAARLLGITFRALRYRMERLGLGD